MACRMNLLKCLLIGYKQQLRVRASGRCRWGRGCTYNAPPLLDSMPSWFEAIMKLMMPTPEVAILMQKMVRFR